MVLENKIKEKLDELTQQNQILQWTLENKKTSREEFYLNQSTNGYGAGQAPKVDLDQNRKVQKEELLVGLYIPKDGDQHGFASGPIDKNKDMESQIEALMEQAKVNSEKVWTFPELTPSSSSTVETAYQPLVEDFSKVSQKIYNQLDESVNHCDQGEFNSAELFVIMDQSKTWASNGYVGEHVATKIYTEVCFSHTNESGHSEELVQTQWAAHPEQIDFNKLCKNSTEGAKASLETSLPKTGKYHVLVDGEVSCQLFSMLAGQFSASRKYNSLPHKEIDSVLISDFSGTPFRLELDATQSYGFSSHEKDPYGQKLEPLILAEKNKVLNQSTSPQMAQYLNFKPNGYMGNIKVEPEFGLPINDLRVAEDEVLEILQFSALFTNMNNLTFSSEIRLAKLWNKAKGSFKYIKGGNLSGSLSENFKTLRFAK